MSEEVYARLNYKEYSFTDAYKNLVKKLSLLDYNIYYFSLYLQNVELFRQRLDRDSHHNYQSFSIQNSIEQQNKYLEISNELEKVENINVHRLEMDDFSKSYEKVKRLLKIR